MLELIKNTTLNGVVKIDNKPVIYLNATIDSKNGCGANINKTIANQDLYLTHKEEVRVDVAAFESAIYELEDELNLKTLEEK